MRQRLLVSLVVAAAVLLQWTPANAQATPPSSIDLPPPVQKGFSSEGQRITPYKADRLLVKLRESAARSIPFEDSRVQGSILTGLSSFDALNQAAGVQRIMRTHAVIRNTSLADRIGLSRWHTLELAAPGDMEALANRYRNDPDVEAATPDYRAFPSAVPNDPIYPDQWGHNNTGQMLDYCWGCGGHPNGSPVGTPGFDSDAEVAWNAPAAYGSSSIIVAILDSGVDIDHPDLVGNLMAGFDFGDNDSNPDDDSASPGHGTATSGVAAAVSNNGLGVSGIAGGCTIMPLKVADSGGSLFFSYIQSALIYAADNGAHIASMSFGAAITSDPATDNALEYAFNNGVTLLAATGNRNQSQIEYPAIHPDVIGVGAASPCGDRKRSSSSPAELNPGVSPDPNGYTCDGERWWGSTYGVNSQDAAGAVDVIAPTIMPTTDIAGAGGYDPGDYDLWFNGTSCSTPYAAGVCALILSANPTWTPAQVRTQLVNTATDIVNVESVAGWDRYSGYGMVNAGAAVGGTFPPVADFSGTPTSGTAPLFVQFTDLSTNNPTSWSWDFGDMNTSTLQNPGHTYNAAGTYTVSLTATNNDGSDTETKVGYITVNPSGGTVKRYALSDIPVSGTVNGTFTNTQSSNNVYQSITERESGGKKNNRYSFLEHRWDFDVAAGSSVTFKVEAYRPNNSDGDDFTFEYSTDNSNFTPLLTVSAESEQVYSAAMPSNLSGTVYVRVVDTDQTAGNRSLDWVFVDEMYIESVTGPITDPPVADFVGSPTSGDAPLAVSFTDQSTNSPTSWSWDFGDLNTSTEQNPTHTYTSAGTYTVSLTATNANGSDTMTKVDYITVTTPTGTVMHVADITVTRTSSGPWWRGSAQVTVVDQNDVPVANAVVSGFFSAPNGNTKSGTTDASGVATMTSDKTRTPPANWCFRVTDVVLGGATYNPAANVWTERCEDGSGSVTVSPPTLATSAVPEDYGLHQNHPNPFNPITHIGFQLPVAGHVTIEIFDVAGRRVAVAAEGSYTAGVHAVPWDASQLPSGVYVYRIRAAGFQQMKKMVLLK